MICKKNKMMSEPDVNSEHRMRTVPLVNRCAMTLRDSDVTFVTAGISGGADSVAMLIALKECGIRVIAVHCNFHLRGEESERDRRFVESLCAKLEIPLKILDFDVKAYMESHKVSVEMACRELRYAEFRRILRESGADRIAVAHNADDNAETLLLNLMRGAGVAGLRGMRTDTGEIIRPLLDSTRQDILEYLESSGQKYVTDSTNLQSDYRRNFLRNEVIPLLESRWPEAKKAICRTTHIMRQEEQMLLWAEKRLAGNSGNRLSLEAAKTCPDPLWLINRFIARFGGTPAQSAEITASIHACPFQSGKQWILPKGKVILERECLEYKTDLRRPLRAVADEHENTDELLRHIAKAPLTELWTDLAPADIVFRHPSQGDRIKPLGMHGSVLVSKIMKDAKLTQAEKEDMMLAEEKATGEIIWIDGLKRSRTHLVLSGSQKCFRYARAANEDQSADEKQLSDIRR